MSGFHDVTLDRREIFDSLSVTNGIAPDNPSVAGIVMPDFANPQEPLIGGIIANALTAAAIPDAREEGWRGILRRGGGASSMVAAATRRT